MDSSRIEEMALYEKNHYWFWGKRHTIKTLLSHLPISSSARLLDVGCGTGALLNDLHNLYQVEGIDPSHKAKEFCAEKNITISSGAAECLPYNDAQFKVITMSDVLEHVKNDAQAIYEAYRVLSPGGYLLITVPAHPLLFGKHDKALDHYRRYTKKEIDMLLKSVPFKIKKITYTNPMLLLPAILLRVIEYIFPSEKPEATRNGNLPLQLNKLAKFWYFVEGNWLSYFSIPFGLSLLCLAQKPIKSI